MEYRRFLPFSILILITLLTFKIYSPGLKGGFLFDDYYNLAEMSHYGDPHDWNAAKKFVTNGGSGPTGRPIALASFLVHADSWTEEAGWLGNAEPFKRVNLYIHLLCGLFLFIVIRLLLKSYGYAQQKIEWIAVLATSFWLIHPLFVSTTLYVIQRMAQLPLLFSLIAMIGYLKGRALIEYKPLMAYGLMTVSVGLGTLLATFSKENGALLPLLILVIEFCNPQRMGKPIWQWRAVCLWLPSVAIAVLLIRYIDFSKDLWPNRSFNQVERLWSEGRIVTDYLRWLWMPRIEGSGLLQDGFIVSRGWFSPVSTLFSAVFLLGLFIASFIVRSRYPLIALAILFFFAAHLMESTVLGLELYFEHRNYIAAIFMFLPLAAGLCALTEKIQLKVVVLISVLIITLLAWMTWQRSVLWSDNDKLEFFWAQNNPNSERGQVFMAQYLSDRGQYGEAHHLLVQALKKHPQSGLIAFQMLQQKIKAGTASTEDFSELQMHIATHRSDPQALIRARDITVIIIGNEKNTAMYAKPMLNVLDALIKPNSPYKNVPNLEAMILVLKGLLSVALAEPELGYKYYDQAIRLDPDMNKSMAMVADLGNHGHRQLALKLLDVAEAEYRKQPDSGINRSRVFFDEKIVQLRKNLILDLKKDHEAMGNIRVD
ncbi:hypothetical protein [Acinetobacter sp. G11]|uniref:hypothetical protein n=1 Tax=Acinetobacter sp. G11 TaxID=3415989 RepID=UPI003C7B6D6E